MLFVISVAGQIQNSAQRLLMPTDDRNLVIGGYGQIDYNQPFGGDANHNGNLDVHRLVVLLGYHFTDNLQVITEIEYEHISEVYVEQAFLNYRLNNFVNLRGGLMLIPVGIVNEYHEPPLFNGVERPNVDKYIIPTTWREIGAGLTGTFGGASLMYQAYVVNGFLGYDGAARFNGKNGLRGGRQKGAESVLSHPNYTMKLEYFGIPGLNVGLSGYFGKSQSTLYNGLGKSDDSGLASADSSVVGISMVGIDARYNFRGFEFTGQFVFNSLGNTKQYNGFAGTDLGSSMLGYYLELGYDLLHGSGKDEQKLVPFIRYENYNTHQSVEQGTAQNLAYNRTDITVGLGYWFTSKVVVKADYQRFANKADQEANQFNMGIGFMF
jgi:hypothetical protein